MRLYDQLMANGATSLSPDTDTDADLEEIAALNVAQAVVIDVTNVATYAMAHMPVITPDDAPIRVSPWTTAWFEWSFTPELPRVAVLLEQIPLESGAHLQTHALFVNSADPNARPIAVAFQNLIVAPNGEVYKGAGPLPITHEERRALEAAGCELPIARNGAARRILVPLEDAWGESMEPTRTHVRNWMDSAIAIVALATTFAHCKNVKLQEHHTPPKVAAKRKKAGKPPGTSYKTLLIDPMKEVLRTEGNIEKNGLKKALHIVRGHFATYTEDKPLFGKVTGTFWKPMHARGNKKHGEIKKDYVIGAPD